ncbi:PaaX family transcriptional regulator C-terminal domain-containing protein [Paenarthrobacter sp. NPDC089675]|uniref:PaaX family transcriptional regulator n=1 Tax=Paenarthrobacter sp. NPDC089675 TaxID=3364376 RepID=UPI00382B713E
MSAVLDDMDSRPGSTTSLMRTVIGLYLREAGGWMPTKSLVSLMEALGTSGTVARTALGRLRKKGVLLQEMRGDAAGFTLTGGAAAMLARGDRRIFTPRSMAPADPWCLVSFSIPETEREKRHQLRRRLHWIGCGTVAAGLWICPDSLRDEVKEILDDLQLRGMATIFVAREPLVEGTLQEAAAKWWELDAVAALHRDFLKQHQQASELADGAVPVADARSFATYVRSIDSWRIIPYLDPGLPATFLPDDWPGAAAAELFGRIRQAYSGPSADFVQRVLREGES